jgi:hypothetical protein
MPLFSSSSALYAARDVHASYPTGLHIHDIESTKFKIEWGVIFLAFHCCNKNINIKICMKTNLIRMVDILFLPFIELFFPLLKLNVKSFLGCRQFIWIILHEKKPSD